MKLWLTCFLLLFFGAETLQWLGQVPWLDGVVGSWPMALVGGGMLAIASNAQFRQQSAPLEPATKPATPPESAPLPTASAPAVPNSPLKSSPSSISFEIAKPKRGS
jgi:hypothetical protein